MSSTRPYLGIWSAPERVSQVGTLIASLNLSVNAQGVAVAAWERDHGVASVEAAVRFGAPAWSSPVTLDDVSNVTTSNLDVVVRVDGSAVVAWSDGSVKAVRMNAVGSWEGPSQVISGAGTTGDLTLGVSDDGRVNAVFDETPGPRAYLASTSPGGVWGASVAISPLGEDVGQLTSATADGGLTTVVWTDRTTSNGPYRIRSATRQDPSLPFNATVSISDPLPIDVDDVTVAVNRYEDAVAGWSRRETDGSSSIQVATKVKSLDWKPVKTLFALPGAASASASAPSLSVLVDGTALAAWSYPDSNGTVWTAVKPPDGEWGAATRLPTPGKGSVAGDFAHDNLRGDAVLVWTQTVGNAPTGEVFASPYDTTPPTVGLSTFEEQGFVGVPVTFGADPTDLWSGVSTPIWDFGDGQAGGGKQITHTYTRPGIFNFTAKTEDSVSLGASDTRTISVVNTRVKTLRISSRSFKASKRDPAKVTYTMNLGVPVTFTIERARKGRVASSVCVKATKRNRRRKACPRWTPLRGSFTSTETGVNSGKSHITGWLNNHKLSPGSYRLRATPKFRGFTGDSLTAMFTLRR